VRALLDHGADVSQRARFGESALFQASCHGKVEVMGALLERGADVNVQTFGGRTPLMCACRNGEFLAATLLVDAGADLALRDNNGTSALDFAEMRVAEDDEEPNEDEGEEPPTDEERAGHLQLVALLEERGAARRVRQEDDVPSEAARYVAGAGPRTERHAMTRPQQCAPRARPAPPRPAPQRSPRLPHHERPMPAKTLDWSRKRQR